MMKSIKLIAIIVAIVFAFSACGTALAEDKPDQNSEAAGQLLEEMSKTDDILNDTLEQSIEPMGSVKPSEEIASDSMNKAGDNTSIFELPDTNNNTVESNIETIPASSVTSSDAQTEAGEEENTEKLLLSQNNSAADFVWEFNDTTKTAKVIGYVGGGGDVVVPASVEGANGTVYTVTDIAAGSSTTGAFSNNNPNNNNVSEITSITLPDTLISASADYWFDYCHKLKFVYGIPETLRSMRYTFRDCALQAAPEIPVGVTDIEMAFSTCTSLEKVPILPNSITNMKGAFSFCYMLSEIPEIPRNVTNMEVAFYSCLGLSGKEITIYADPAETADMFGDIYNITLRCYEGSSVDIYAKANSIPVVYIVESTSTDFVWEFDDAAKTAKVIGYIGGGEDVIVPLSVTGTGEAYGNEYGEYTLGTAGITYTVTDIGRGAFSLYENEMNVGCADQITSVYLPDTLTSTSAEAWFSGCLALENVYGLPDTLKTMYQTFYDCMMMKTAPEIPGSVTEMEETFYACTVLEEAPTLPTGVTNLSGCFQDCSSLTKAPAIPEDVNDMSGVFYGCTELSGQSITIYASPAYTRDMLFRISGVTLNCYKDSGIDSYAQENPEIVSHVKYFGDFVKQPQDVDLTAGDTAASFSVYLDKNAPVTYTVLKESDGGYIDTGIDLNREIDWSIPTQTKEFSIRFDDSGIGRYKIQVRYDDGTTWDSAEFAVKSDTMISIVVPTKVMFEIDPNVDGAGYTDAAVGSFSNTGGCDVELSVSDISGRNGAPLTAYNKYSQVGWKDLGSIKTERNLGFLFETGGNMLGYIPGHSLPLGELPQGSDQDISYIIAHGNAWTEPKAFVYDVTYSVSAIS